MLEKDTSEKRKERHKITQEDFTPQSIVEGMLSSLCPNHFENEIEKTILDPSCGNGNFLNEILQQKLSYATCLEEGIVALQSIYGVELMADNVNECRERLFNTFISKYNEKHKLVKNIIKNRIVWYNSLLFNYDNFDLIEDKEDDTDFLINYDNPMWGK